MKTRLSCLTIALFGTATLLGFPTHWVAAQEAPPAHAHIGHVADAFRGTPDGMGLLPTAVLEAEVARQHATLAGADPSDLASVQRHTGHVMHALDAESMERGPGKGYGLIRAAEGVVRHIELAARSEGASDGVKTHSVHVAASAGNTVTRATRMMEICREIMGVEEGGDASALVAEMVMLGDQLVDGHDADGDGRIGWQEGEGGLSQAQTHLGLMKRGEGIG